MTALVGKMTALVSYVTKFRYSSLRFLKIKFAGSRHHKLICYSHSYKKANKKDVEYENYEEKKIQIEFLSNSKKFRCFIVKLLFSRNMYKIYQTFYYL